MSVWHVKECRHTQVRCTSPCSLNPVLQSCTTPRQFDMWKNADVPRSDVTPTPPPPLIKTSATEPYYIMSVWHVEECRHTQVRCTSPCSLYPVLQSCTTPCQFDMWKNADVPRSDVTPTQVMEPSATEPYYTMSVWHVAECRWTHIRCTLPTNWTQCYRVVLYHVSLTFGRMQT